MMTSADCQEPSLCVIASLSAPVDDNCLLAVRQAAARLNAARRQYATALQEIGRVAVG